jgi:hypothetical protein
MKRWIILIVAALMIFSLSCSLVSGGREGSDNGASVEATVERETEDASDEDASDEDASDEDASDEDASGEDASNEDASNEDASNEDGSGASDDGGSDDETDDAEESTMEQESAELEVETDALEQLQSYRTEMTWVVQYADGTVEEFTMQQAATQTPAATRFSIEAEDGSIEFIQVEDQVYVRFGDQWMQSSSDEVSDMGDEFGGVLSGEDWIDEIEAEDYEYVGQETVNGLNTRHYNVQYDERWFNYFGDEESIDDIDSGTAEIWIADEGDLPQFVVRLIVEMTGTLNGEEGTAILTINVVDVNQPFVIEVPETAASGGLPDDIPLYPGAQEVTSLGTITIFKVEDDVETVNDYYESELENAGWSKTEDVSSSPAIMNTVWEKDDRTLDVTIAENEDEGNTNVMLTIETAE